MLRIGHLSIGGFHSLLKSNGLHCPKIRLKKFSFSPKTVPANIVKKLPSQRCPKPLFIASFNFSHKRLTFAFTGESEYTHSALLKGSHTAAHRAKRGRFGWGRYYYPRTVSHVSETLRGRVSERRTLPLLGLGRERSRRTQRACGTAMRLCASLFRGVAAPLGCAVLLIDSSHCISLLIDCKRFSTCLSDIGEVYSISEKWHFMVRILELRQISFMGHRRKIHVFASGVTNPHGVANFRP